MDAANLTEKYILWSNILDLRSRGINIARTARRLGVSRNTVRHLQSLSLEEVLQQKERHYKLHAYEQAVASLLISFPSISSSRIGDYLREHYPDFPHVCEKTVHNYVQFIRKKHHIPPARYLSAPLPQGVGAQSVIYITLNSKHYTLIIYEYPKLYKRNKPPVTGCTATGMRDTSLL